MRRALGKIAQVTIAVVVILAALIGIGAAVGPSVSTTTSQSSSPIQMQAASSITQPTTPTPQTTSPASLTSTTTSSQSSVTSSGQTTTTGSSSVASTAITTSTFPSNTLQDLIAGKFPTATDKQGTKGVTVSVHSLFVLYVRTESDRDWHVAVTDGKVPVFVTEITSLYQSSLGKPTVGSTIDETGIAYCDTVHQTESWHGNTCWEIHPITAWHRSASNATATTTSQTFATELNASISYARNLISRGSTQTITIHVNDADGAVSNVSVSVHVDYASGQTAKDLNCTTATDGSCAVAWLIGGNSNTGTFNVKVLIEGVVFYSSFQVTTASGG